MSLTLRTCRPSDQEAVLRVNERALRASPVTFVPAIDEDLRRIPEAYADGAFLVGEVGGRVVVTGGFRPVDGETVELRRVRVDPDHQREGHGRRIVETLEARARETGAERATLETNARLRAARALYETLGYERTGRQTHPESGVELVSYRRDL